MSEDRCPTTVADRIREIFAGRSQGEMARRLGISQPNISRYLQGAAPGTAFLKALAEIEGVDIAWLLTGKSAAPATPSKSILAADLSGVSDQELYAELRRRVRKSANRIREEIGMLDEIRQELDRALTPEEKAKL